MIPSPAIAPSSTEGLSTLHHPSPLHLVNSAHKTLLKTSSDSKIPPKSPLKSIVNSAPALSQPDKNGNTTVLSPSAPPKTPGDSALGRPPTISNKRKRDSEPRGINGLQLREAQERVEQKRAKIAARVPSGRPPENARSTQARRLTTLADLYVQMRRDDASGQQDETSAPTPSPTAAVPNGRAPHRRPQNDAPRDDGRSPATSPDPIAMSEDDPEIVVLRHIRRSSPQVRAPFRPATQHGPPTHLDLLSKVKSRVSTPRTITSNGVDKHLDLSRKSKPAFAVVVPSPPKRPMLKPALVDQNTTPRSIASRSQDLTPAGTPVPKSTERLKEITNEKAPESLVSHTPSSALVRPTRSVESIPDSLPEHGSRRVRRGVAVSENLTARDIDALLGAVPVPFDFTLSRRHLATATHDDDDDDVGGESDEGNEESSLWWFHPTFEARAKADIRRTLGALLPADPAQDPPPFGSLDADGWRAEMLPRESGARMWAERLEDAFGPGPLDRGMGRKPRRVARPAGAARRGGSAGSSRSRHGSARPGALVIVNSHGPAPRTIEPPRPPSPSQRKSSDDDAVDADAAPPPASVETPKTNVSDEEATVWTAALLPLVKGKTTIDEARLARTSDALDEVERANQRGGFAREVLKESALADTVRRLGELESVPFGDAHRLRRRARTLADRWREAFGDEVVDLQRGVLVLLHSPGGR